MIQKADKIYIKDIFSHCFYKIPPYQRAYSWKIGKNQKSQQIDEFFDDIYENDEQYFIGTFISIDNEIQELIDGQQRITTIAILFNALYNFLNAYDKNATSLAGNQTRKLHSYLDNLEEGISKKQELRLTLSLQDNNEEDYAYLCYSQNKLGQILNKPVGFEERKIYQNYIYFYQKIKQIDKEFGLDEVLNFVHKFFTTILVKISVKNEADAFSLFAALNSKGLPLTPFDLIKNLFIKYLPTQASVTNQKWQEVLENLENEKWHVSYLRHYYNAFKGKIGIPSFPNATRSNIMKIYSLLINVKEDKEKEENQEKVQKLFYDMIEKSRIYSQFINNDKVSPQFLKYKKILADINRSDFLPSYALLLYMFSEKSAFDLTFILKTLKKWNIRRQISQTFPTGKMDAMFLELIKAIENSSSQESLDENFLKALQQEKFTISDNALLEALNKDLYHSNNNKNKILKLILVMLENSKKDNEERVDFWEVFDGKKALWEIEHILPQNPDKNSSYWQDFSKGEHEKYLNKLGNLTLTAYNAKLSNKDFEDKLNHTNGFKSGKIKINAFIAEQKKWTKETIDERGKILKNELLELLKV